LIYDTNHPLDRPADFAAGLNDAVLPQRAEYLQTLKDVENVRTIEKRGWRNRAMP